MSRPREMWRRMRDADRLERKVKALFAAMLTGAAMLALMQYVVLPKVARDITPAQRIWLREAFMTHTGWLLLAIVALAALFSLPVLLAASWILRRRM